jgi:hypothetical protein
MKPHRHHVDVKPQATDLGDSTNQASDVICVLTRFRLRSPWRVVHLYLDYRRVLRNGLRIPGLLQADFSFSDPRTCLITSFWADQASIRQFGTFVPYHVVAGNRVFGSLDRDANGPTLWSAKWRLMEAGTNMNWPGLVIGRSLRIRPKP